jgi:hypothetical protein
MSVAVAPPHHAARLIGARGGATAGSPHNDGRSGDN